MTAHDEELDDHPEYIEQLVDEALRELYLKRKQHEIDDEHFHYMTGESR